MTVPPFFAFDAPKGWAAIDFISDLHLSPQTPRTLEAFEAYFSSTDADAVMLLGDVFEVWVGDDTVESGFEARCAEILAHASAHRSCALMVGNRDFLIGQRLLKHCGLVGLADPTVLNAFGQSVLLTHGDALCLGDVAYQEFRQKVRSPQWQREFLSRPLGQRRELARQMRDASEKRKRELEPESYADVDGALAIEWMDAAGSSTMIHGHTHRPGTSAFDERHIRHVLSDWDLDDERHPRAEVLRLTAAGFHRRSVPLGADLAR